MASITTAARRIARTLNSHRPGWRLYFDLDGYVVHRIFGPEAFSPPRNSYVHAFATYQETGPAGRTHRYTQRAVQDAIDATAATAATQDPAASPEPTEQVIERLAAEAEQGYDLARLRPRGATA